jgi:hypothetical protein
LGIRVTWAQALAWRLERHLLEPVSDLAVEEVVRRLCGVQAQVASSADLAVRVRQSAPRNGGVAQALADGRLVKTWAMRGTLHLLHPQTAGNYLALLAMRRSWESGAWQRYFGVTPAQIEALRGIATEVLGDRALTREELVAEVCARRGYEHLGDALRSGWGTLLKPLAWQGDLVQGPMRGTRVTFMRPRAAARAWAGIPDVEVAGPQALLDYFGAYGPATLRNFNTWLSRGAVAKRDLTRWMAQLSDQLATVEIEGTEAHLPADQLDSLAAAKRSSAVRLLPGFDQWVLGAGTDDERVVPPGRRASVSRTAGWIAPVVVVGGVVSGTWELDAERVRVSWFGELGAPPRARLEKEVRRLGDILGSELVLEVAA